MIFRSEIAGTTSAASWAIRHIAKASTRTSIESRIRSASNASELVEPDTAGSRRNRLSKSELFMGARSCRGGSSDSLAHYRTKHDVTKPVQAVDAPLTRCRETLGTWEGRDNADRYPRELAGGRSAACWKRSGVGHDGSPGILRSAARTRFGPRPPCTCAWIGSPSRRNPRGWAPAMAAATPWATHVSRRHLQRYGLPCAAPESSRRRLQAVHSQRMRAMFVHPGLGRVRSGIECA